MFFTTLLLACVVYTNGLTCHCTNRENPVEKIFNDTLKKARYLESTGRCEEVGQFLHNQMVKVENEGISMSHFQQAPSIHAVSICNNTYNSRYLTGFASYVQAVVNNKSKCVNGFCTVTRRMCRQNELCHHFRLIPACSLVPQDCAYVNYHAQRYCRKNRCNHMDNFRYED
jgi:hypothetical protein